jgi:hypothetical protein
VQILAALFMDGIELRQVAGPSTRIDLTGIQFSAPAPSPPPCTVSPHLVVILHNPIGGKTDAALEVVFRLGETQLARNVQSVSIEPGKFGYRLVRGELSVDSLGTIEAHCRIDLGPATVVPYTLLDPVG